MNRLDRNGGRGSRELVDNNLKIKIPDLLIFHEEKSGIGIRKNSIW